MVAHSGATVRADRLRPLNVPRPLRVDADERGWPVAVYLGTREAPTPTPPPTLGEGQGERALRAQPPTPNSQPPAPVLEILDRWRIDDEWWRKEISRMYFQVVLGPPLGAAAVEWTWSATRNVPQVAVGPAEPLGAAAGEGTSCVANGAALEEPSWLTPVVASMAVGPADLMITIFHDLIEDGWFAQTTATPLEQAEPVHMLAPAEGLPAAAGRDGQGSGPTRIRRVG